MGRFTDAQLEEYRSKGDPVADAVIQRVLDADRAADINLMVSAFVENDDVVPELLPPFAREYFEDSDDLPEWADMGRIHNGQRFFNEYGAEMALMLSLASLPVCYGCQRGAEVLARSHRIAKPANRRIFETTQFVLNVMEVGGLDPQGDGRGLRSIQKVRLMHASIRYYIRQGQADPPFDAKWGLPINQEDMVNTLMSFSRVTVNGLRNLGHRLDPIDEEDFFHTWRVIGHLMGVDEELNPQTSAEGQALMEQICARNWVKSAAGTELTAAVLDFVEEVIPLRFMDGYATTLMRRAIGDRLADMLEVPPANWTRHLLLVSDAVAQVEDLVGRDLGRERLLATLGRHLLVAFLALERAKPAPFRIPPSLTQNWT